MTDSDDKEKSLKRCYAIIMNSPGITATYREKLFRNMHKLHDPGAVAAELCKKIKDKGLRGEHAAKYFFKSFMNAVNE